MLSMILSWVIWWRVIAPAIDFEPDLNPGFALPILGWLGLAGPRLKGIALVLPGHLL